MSWWHQSHAGAASGAHRQLPQLLVLQQLMWLSLAHQGWQAGQEQAGGVGEVQVLVPHVGAGAGAAASAAQQLQQ
jgi:hypothetical protein